VDFGVESNSWIATLIVVIGIVLIMIKLYYIKQRLSFDSTKNALDDATIISAEQQNDQPSSTMRQSLLQNQFTTSSTELSSTIDEKDEMNVEGTLNKFEHEGYMTKLGRRVGRWSEKKRYFILKGSKLYCFKDQKICANILKLNHYSLSSIETTSTSSDDVKIVNLVGYECMIDMDNMKNNYYPISLITMDANDTRGNKYFRVTSAKDQKLWLNAFVIASLIPK
jgi:hypothetical protein